MVRKINRVFKSIPLMEGAGVQLKRAFGVGQIPLFDPFLLLDDFRSDEPEKYLKGFPWHPHRGIETVTYILQGEVEHSDSIYNKGTIHEGDVQWMTAGSGIIHQEMPRGNEDGKMHGFQLWTNLPSSHKMIPPKYREIKNSQIPDITINGNVKIKIISGEVNGIKGPVDDIISEPVFLDISIPSDTIYSHPAKKGSKVFVYIIDGKCNFSEEGEGEYENRDLILFDDGDSIIVETIKNQTVRFFIFFRNAFK